MKISSYEARHLENRPFLDLIKAGGRGRKVLGGDAGRTACLLLDQACDFWFSELPDIGLLDHDNGRTKMDQYRDFLDEILRKMSDLRGSMDPSLSSVLEAEERMMQEEMKKAEDIPTWGDRLNAKMTAVLNCLESTIYWITLLEARQNDEDGAL